MPLQATSGAASYDAFGGGVPVEPVYIEQIFSTWLYTGNGSTQTITNGIDLAGKGGMVWLKSRSGADPHELTNTLQGISNSLRSNSTNGASATDLTGFTSSGFTLGNVTGNTNSSGATYASWTFRKQPKFFDVVTYTGNGTTNRTVAHNLGSRPGFIAIKRTDSTSNWYCAARIDDDTAAVKNETAGDNFGFNQTDKADLGAWATVADSATINLNMGGLASASTTTTNINGATYVAYLWAHNAGGFGVSGNENVISCGSYTGNGGINNITLGYEPQWLMIKRTDTTSDWIIADNMRGLNADVGSYWLYPNGSTSEFVSSGSFAGPEITATGFWINNSGSAQTNASGGTYIYIAIRRGPMKVPTSPATVYIPANYTGTNVDNRRVQTDIVVDMTMARIRATTSSGGFWVADRLRGDAYLGTAVTDAEATDADSFMTPTVGFGNSFSSMNGFGVGNDATRQLNQNSTTQLAYAFARAPGFFDVVCYTGTGSAQTLTHNLAATPELIITKNRTASNIWYTYTQTTGATKYLRLNTVDAEATGANVWNNTAPTSTQFTVGSSLSFSSGDGFVAYLFASCPGVSKIGSYTGNGTDQVIDCGFPMANSADIFLLIKRTDSAGDWYVWANSSSLTTENHLSLNTTAAQTPDNSISGNSSGFRVYQISATDINVNGGTYIFMAIKAP